LVDEWRFFRKLLFISPLWTEGTRPKQNGWISAFIRGGNWDNTTNAGAFTLNLNNAPANSNTNIGFRCVRFSGFTPQPESSATFAVMRKSRGSERKNPRPCSVLKGKISSPYPRAVRKLLSARGSRRK